MLLTALPWRAKTAANIRQEAPAKSLRQDIQGLRAVAVGVVLLYHAGMPWLPGGFVGVDVFFVISGFLITRGIVAELRRNGRISLTGFYARRVARILPAAALAITSTLVLAWVLLPETRWRQIGLDGFASALSYVNWMFAGNSVNYLAQDQAESPFQHFWSLAVEEQFYMVWPLLLLVVGWLSLKLNFRLQRGMLVALALVAVPSFAWSVYLTAANPGAAYFVTTTRGWELAAGCALAIMANRQDKNVPAPVAAVVGWAGLVAIFTAAALYTSATAFPSYNAALPVLGAVAVIWAGAHAGKAGPALLLDLKPMVALGNISYSVYLWHWPLLVIAAGVWGELGPTMGLLLIAVSILPAWVSYVAVERPVQDRLKISGSKAEALGVGVSLTAGGAAAAIILALMVPPTPPATAVEFVPTPVAGEKVVPVGAETLLDRATPRKVVDSFAKIQPAAVGAVNDMPAANTNGCMQPIESSDAQRCNFGDADGEKTIAVVGDSHAVMLLPGFEKVAKERGWKIISYTKGACPWIDIDIQDVNVKQGGSRAFTQCREWVKGVSQALTADKPDLIIAGMSRYRTIEGGLVDDVEVSSAKLIDGMRATWAPLLKMGIPVVSVRDSPQPGVIVPDCVAKNVDKLSRCALKKAEVLRQNPPEIAATDGIAGTSVLDLTESYCFGETCPAVIGGVLVYRDGNHLTAAYARSLHGQIARALAPLVAATK
ncbi:acyltransferase family protein [Arthrobacter pascens]|uniref:acyltransferase family protein n=1 Tax=Arthrobacter pascens TaxID=1677 RepID=UPI00196ABBC2|nr:acyltransferase family protein [Arthrobacter pascens]MBN3499314.1 acyltransferase [Arthrobacter pascens]